MYKQKEKMKQNKILKESRGITLIALVITIIVLLILAGVSIATLIGQGNILENASGAKEQTNEAVENEKLKLAVSSAIINGQGNLSKGKLQDAIGEQFGEEKKERLKGEEEGPWVFEGDIKSYNIDKEETVLAHVPTSKVNALIGQTVDSYTENSNKVDAWRVFYASDTELFLISSNTITSKTAFGEDSAGIPLKQKETSRAYTGATDEIFKIENDESKSNYGAKYNKTYNSLWYAKGMTDTQERSKATAYLCDANNWDEYVNREEGATYAIGGPTLELFVLSWNEAVKHEGANVPQEEVTLLKDDDVKPEGYLAGKPDELYVTIDPWPIQQSILEKLYNSRKELLDVFT